MDYDLFHVEKCLKRLRERYRLSYAEIQQLEKIKTNTITSIAFTENGGFDRNNGEFHEKDREFNYKVRIKYFLKDSEIEKIIVLGVVQDYPNQLVS